MKKILLTILCTLLSTMSWAQSTAAGDSATVAEAYAVLDPASGTTITFYYDDQKTTRGGMSVGPFDYSTARAWDNASGNITSVVFDDSFANCTTLTSTAFWFQGCERLTTFTGISNLKTDNVTDMRYMFYHCSSLTGIDVSNFSTANVTTMRYMFGASGLTTLDISNFNSANVTDMGSMFIECSNLTTIYAGSNWSTAAVMDGNRMFTGCTNLVGGAGTAFSADHTDYTYARIDAEGTPGYFTSKNASYNEAYAVFINDGTNSPSLTMYYDAYRDAHREGQVVGLDELLTFQPLMMYRANVQSVTFDSSFANCRPTSTAYWFNGFSGLTSIGGLEYLVTEEVTNMNSMFSDCTGFTTLDLSNFNTSRVTDMTRMFSGCTALTTIKVGSGWSTASVTSGAEMFSGCTSLTGGAGTAYSSEHVDYAYARIDAEGTPGYLTGDGTKPSETVSAPMFAFDGDNLSMTTETANASIFYKMAELASTDENYVDSVRNSLIVTPDGQQSTYYERPFELVKSAVVKAIAVIDTQAGTIASDTTTMVYDYAAWQSLRTAIEKGTEVYNQAQGNSAVDSTLLADLQWALQEGNMFYRERAMMNSFEATHFAQRIAELCNQIQAQMSATNLEIDSEGYYLLGSVEDWKAFASLVVTNPTASAKMKADINLGDDQTMIGSKSNSYQGVFDGQKYTLTVNLIDSAEVAPFRCVQGATIKNLHVKGRIEAKVCSVGGIISSVLSGSSTTLSRCWSSSLLVSGYSGTEQNTIGGFVAGSEAELIIEDCLFDGQFGDNNYRYNGGFVANMLSNLAIRNSLNVGEYPSHASWANWSGTFYRPDVMSGTATLEKAYYKNVCGTAQGTNVYDTELTNGTITNLLQGERSEVIWVQGEKYPVLKFNDVAVNEPYAVLSDNNTVLTFYYDKQKSARGGMDVEPFVNSSARGWENQRDNITTVVFDNSFAEYHPTSTAMWFQSCSNLKSITNIQYLKTDSVTTMGGMFSGCSSLTNIDLSNFNTDKVTSMFAMFSGCSSLMSLDLSKFNTTNVTETGAMFSSCSSLTSLDLSNFNTSNMTNVSSMFAYSTSLKTLDLSGFRFNSATFLNIRFMFRECIALQTIYVDENWTLPSSINGSSMFEGCTSLVGGAGTIYSADHTDYTYAHIDGGTANPGYFTDKNAPVTLSAPTINVVDDVLTLTTSTAGATIYYTLDGSKPTHQSASYTEPITLKHNCYVRAIAAKEGSEDSEESTYDVTGLSINTKMPAPTVGYDYSSRITLNAPAIYSGTDYSSKVAVEPASWGGVAPDINLAGEWTCEVLNNENTVTETYTVTLKEDGGALFPSPCLEESSTWSYNNGILRMTHYKLLTQEGSYQYANYELTSATPENPMEFTGDRTNTVGNWITENNSTAKVRFIYNGASLPTTKVTTNDGRETVMAISNEGNAEKTGDVLQQTITGLTNGYYTVELYAKSIYSSASPMADDVTYLFANDVNLFIPLEADKTIRPHNVYLIGVQVTDGTIRLGLGKAKTGANWHALQIRSLQSCRLNDDESEQGANIYYRMNNRMLEGNATDFGSGYISGTNWSVAGDNATYSVAYGGYKDSYCLNLTSQKDSTFESAQAIYSFPTPLNKNTYYTLHFKARSASGRGQMMIYCQKDSLEATRTSAETLSVGSELTDYDLTFKIESDSINKFIFNFGSLADTYYIDNVQFGAIISDTTNQHRTLYQGTIDLREGAMIQAVSQKPNMTPSAPVFIDYFYKGWMELRDIEAWSMEILHQAYGNPNVPLELVEQRRAELEYMVTYLYDRREKEHVDDTELLYTLRDLEARVYEVRQMLEGFTVDGVSYHAVDSTQVEVISSLNSTYRGAITIPAEVTYNRINFKVTSVTENAFANTRLTAIRWYPTFALTNADLQRVNNPNLLIYVQSESLAPADRDNVIVNGVAKNVVLTDASDFGDFNCPEAFTAEAIQYTRTFTQQTQIGVSRGWETIALPFTVQTFTHADKGVIAPFGNSASENHFWLRELTQNGLQPAQTIEANKPYVISMPNSEEYRPETNLAGSVTFSALNAVVPVTEEMPVEYGSIALVPSFQTWAVRDEIYALNVGEERDGHPEGSVFERNYRAVRPFEAYTLHRDSQNPAPQYISIGGDMGNGTTGIEELVDKRVNTTDAWYTIDGRKLQGAPTGKGLYIRNGKKVIVR